MVPTRGDTSTDLGVIPSRSISLSAKAADGNAIVKDVADLILDVSPFHPLMSYAVNVFYPAGKYDERPFVVGQGPTFSSVTSNADLSRRSPLVRCLLRRSPVAVRVPRC